MDDEAEKEALAYSRDDARTAFMAGVKWERNKLLELAKSHTTLCGDFYFEMQLATLIRRLARGDDD